MNKLNTINIAIHHHPGSFSDRWIEYCKDNNIRYKIVNCYGNDILKELKDCDGLLWHWHHGNPTDALIARDIIHAVQRMGIEVFPDINTCGTFDNKIAQKYQLEAIEAPLVPTGVFFDESSALDWISQTSFPKVFKLSRGAGSLNVKMVRSDKEAVKLVKKAFGSGFKPVAGQLGDVVGKLMSRTQRNKVDLFGKIIRLPKSIRNIYRGNKFLGRERGYIYFQDFIPDNQYDTRITIIGSRAFGFTRNVRENDFRASGSGSINYDRDRIDHRCIIIAFDVAKSLAAQSIAFDFVMEKTKSPLIVEVSYCYMAEAVYNCGGYWDKDLNWNSGGVWPQDAILEDLIGGLDPQIIMGHNTQ